MIQQALPKLFGVGPPTHTGLIDVPFSMAV